MFSFQVIVFQSYINHSDTLIEAKYVFPLDDEAAVCGFEAYINDKHVVGVVKEKEEAKREYKKAIAEGHGAYLMDEEAPVSMSALRLSNSGDCVFFPGNVHKIQNYYLFCPYLESVKEMHQNEYKQLSLCLVWWFMR